jgi:hypothetical protein
LLRISIKEETTQCSSCNDSSYSNPNDLPTLTYSTYLIHAAPATHGGFPSRERIIRREELYEY